jgi:hypothetical protein
MKPFGVLLISLAAIAGASTIVTIPAIDAASRSALVTKIAEVAGNPRASLCKYYGPDSLVLDKLMKADVKQCRSVLFVHQVASPKLGDGLAEYQIITPSLGHLEMAPAFPVFKANPSEDAWARFMGRADFQFAMARSHGHDCLVINIDEEGSRTLPEAFSTAYGSIALTYPEIAKVVFNGSKPASSRYLSILPVENDRMCFQTKAEQKAEEERARQLATERAVNDRIDAQQAEAIRALSAQVAHGQINEAAIIQAARQKQIEALQAKLADQQRDRQMDCLRKLGELEEELREREFRNRMWMQRQKIYRRRHEARLQQLLGEKASRNVGGELGKEIERVKGSISRLPCPCESKQDENEMFQI